MEKTAERQKQRTTAPVETTAQVTRVNPLVVPGILSALGLLFALTAVETDDPAVEAPVITPTHAEFLQNGEAWNKTCYHRYHPGLDVIVSCQDMSYHHPSVEFPTFVELHTAHKATDEAGWFSEGSNLDAVRIRCKIEPNQVKAQFYNRKLQRWENHSDIGHGHPDHFRSWITEGDVSALERFARYAARRLRMGDKYMPNPNLMSDNSTDNVSILQEPLTQLVLGGLQTLKPSVVSTTPS